nr:hypothetical protein [Tanacetum cinerariifolium]
MAFISSLNTISGKSEVPTVQGASTASAQVLTVSTDVAAASLSYDTVYHQRVKIEGRESYKKDPEVEEPVPKAMIAIDVPKEYALITKSSSSSDNEGIPYDNIDDKGYWDSGCSRHMTGTISYLSEYEPFNGGYVSFGHERRNITGKGSIKTDKLKFENVYFMEELKYNMFSV